jgi:hypothetical protein
MPGPLLYGNYRAWRCLTTNRDAVSGKTTCAFNSPRMRKNTHAGTVESYSLQARRGLEGATRG